MGPTWLVSLLAEDRARSVSSVDEHGRPKEEEVKLEGLVYPGDRKYSSENYRGVSGNNESANPTSNYRE